LYIIPSGDLEDGFICPYMLVHSIVPTVRVVEEDITQRIAVPLVLSLESAILEVLIDTRSLLYTHGQFLGLIYPKWGDRGA